ncbi:class I SAM-dependent DNA methyltransferase [Nocardioides sp. Bht2]|uniref:HsdM family class I SAM-dependent methyltransferase n=1 Tax=Nocardioides sp. Bht2 TaxID=3392297 RepID=UPI0039B54CD0
MAVAEFKDPSALRTPRQVLKAQEQAVWHALALGVNVAIVTDGTHCTFLDASASANNGEIVPFAEPRDLSPAVLADLLHGGVVMRDPKPLAESVWQLIWHATKAEPKECLLTFVEIFMLKFLSDNLSTNLLPQDYRFDVLLADPNEFLASKGQTQIEYYVDLIRPRIKGIFTENTKVNDQVISAAFGLDDIPSTTSVINGFAFLKSPRSTSGATYNRIFCEILQEFKNFGTLTAIEPEFKLRLYETFLRKSARQQRLGQFFTPRNLVRPMIRMARLNGLEEGSIVLDPAAGVGGFLLETLLFSDALPGNVNFRDGLAEQKVRLVGVDVDEHTNILAKANMLLHLAESVRDPETTPSALNQALVNTFLLMNQNETLGALLQPPRNSIDVILTNPPYVTQGSSIYRRELEQVEGPRNGVLLSEYYDTGGLGVEALFLRYVTGALKPGGRAFIIVPLGLLNRTAARMKANIIAECNILASIALPRNAFFNTAQPTYILALEKRRTPSQSRPPVFCGIARSIGETLDYERVATPDQNDLMDIAELFVQYVENDLQNPVSNARPYADSSIAKLVPAELFSADDRWDVLRHWSESEQVALGQRAEAIDRREFLEQVTNTFSDLLEEMGTARAELDALEAGPMERFSLADSDRFQVRSGTRVRNTDLRDFPGTVPVYSVFTKANAVKGYVDPEWLFASKGALPERYPSATVMATGASAVGLVHLREAGAVMTDDVVIVQPWPSVPLPGPFAAPGRDLPKHDIDLEYLTVALARSITQGGYMYEAKLYVRRVQQLSIEVPVDEAGRPDLDRQRAIAKVSRRIDDVRERIDEAARWIKTTRLS